MNDTAHGYLRQTITALIALSLVLSVFGPVGTVAADPSVSIEQTADSTTVEPGETVTVTTTLTAQDVNGPLVEMQFPDGWEGTVTDSDGGTVRPQDNESNVLPSNSPAVLWLNSGTYEVTTEVQVPEDTDPGEYTISATGSGVDPTDDDSVANEEDEIDSTETTITVQEPDQNEGPSASFTASPSAPEAGETVSFDASASSDADGTIESYEWDFDDDGDVDTTGEQVTTAFDAAGDYDVTLTVTDDDGATDTATQTISVSEAATPASFQLSDLSVESPVTQGDASTVTATVENVGDEEGTQTVALDVDDSEVDTQSVTLDGDASQQVSFDIDTADLSVGDHDVTLSTDDDSVSTTLSVTEETPTNQDPSAAFDTSPSDPETGETVTFDASASTDADGSVASYEWDFGDGETASGESVTHAYDSAGDYDVTLTVTDDDGATDTATQTVSVSEPADPEPEPDLSTAVSLSPSEDLVAVNGTTTFDVVVEDADGGVGAYSLALSVDDGETATIEDVLVDESALSDVQISADGSSATVDVALLDTEQNGSVTVATVTVAGAADGEAAVGLDVSSLGTESGDAYNVTAANGATLTVSELVIGGSEQPAQDLDGDGVYEDVNGDGEVDELDVQLLFAERNSAVVQNSPDAFDFNGDGKFDILDIQALYYQEVA
jgi:PKD repeat protein